MTDSEIKIIDGKQVVVGIQGLSTKMFNAVFEELVIGTNNIRNRIIRSMQETRRAPWFYKRGNKRHYPSAPGNAPAIDREGLVSRIVTDVRSDEIEVGVSAGAPYAEFLEDTQKLNRPFLLPAVEEESEDFEKNILAAMNAAAEDALK